MKKILRKITKKYLKKHVGVNLCDIEDGQYINKASISINDYNGNPDQKYGGIIFSQHGEDVMLLNIFDKIGIKQGSYWDIGAHHPYNISNTALLYKKGWRGINIEANPNLIEEFYKQRPDDVNLCIGLGEKEAVMPFYMIDEWSAINSFDKDVITKFVDNNPSFKIKEVKNIEVKTLHYVLENYANNEYPDLMDFDVENLEYDILKNCDFSEDGPKVIIIERPKKILRDLVSDWGYFEYCLIGPNSFYVRNEYKNLLYSKEN